MPLLAASESGLVGRVPLPVSLAGVVVVLIILLRVSIDHIGEDYDRRVVDQKRVKTQTRDPFERAFHRCGNLRVC